jgi:hypothetical protein
MSLGRVLFISPTDMYTKCGMEQRQRQLLCMLGRLYPGSVDVLALGASAARARIWLRDAGLDATVLKGVYPLISRLNATLWYGSGVVLCNKLRWTTRFHFPLCTPLPRRWVERYHTIVAFYPWAHRLLRLERGGTKVVVDLGDVMANRHERTGSRRWISLTSRDEEYILRSPSRCIAISQDDAHEFKRLYDQRLPVVSFVPPEMEELAALATDELPHAVGYMAAPSDVNENVMSILSETRFLECLAREKIELIVAGGICNTASPSILRSMRNGGVRVLGRVNSTKEYYSQICATVNPVGPSTGVKIKSVETLMAGRYLITTRWGADSDLWAAFSDQITYVDWPMDAGKLAEVTVSVVRAAVRRHRFNGTAYASRVDRALQEILEQ